jgi:hypothetical protein
MPKLVYIAGCGRSGSTLLDLLLGNHPNISGLGEVHRLSIDQGERLCSCEKPIMQCEYWRPRIEALCTSEGVALSNWTETLYTTSIRDKAHHERRFKADAVEVAAALGSKKLLKLASLVSEDVASNYRAAKNSWALFDEIGIQDNSDVVVDASKNALRMKLLYMERPESAYILHLVRDGRAVAASALRRKQIPVRRGAKKWRIANRNVELALKTIPENRVLRVRYEDLCDDTEGIMRSICRFVGMAYDPRMTKLRKREAHDIPGNPMLFRDAETEIVKDERWKRLLGSEDRRAFLDVASKYSVKYGYHANAR